MYKCSITKTNDLFYKNLFVNIYFVLLLGYVCMCVCVRVYVCVRVCVYSTYIQKYKSIMCYYIIAQFINIDGKFSSFIATTCCLGAVCQYLLLSMNCIMVFIDIVHICTVYKPINIGISTYNSR